MKFTLIICTYMRPKPLQTLLQSVTAQTVYPNEILIVDGSRNSETEEMLNQNSFKNLSYFKVDDAERGLTKQRNFGIRNVTETSEIVCFLDDDTILDKNYFKNLIATYSVYPNALGVGGFITNEVHWTKIAKNTKPNSKSFVYDGWFRNESVRFRLRLKLGLLDETKPCYLPSFAHGRSVSFLPPTDKVYPVELFMGGVSSFKKNVLDTIKFSTYFEGYGLYEDADFTLRVSKLGQLYVNTAAKLEHHHNIAGRPNKYSYGKMVVKNGWYVWRIKYENPTLKSRLKWNATVLFLAFLRFTNIFTQPKKKEAFTESFGRIAAWFKLWFQKPQINRDTVKNTVS
ncbi:MAG: glycosyltransferase family 2 protein [Kordia sp.]|uniref:glycosyltransferase family 2 protein n=1 Tax=Kordia sp. TaxID=1965332 RepID=UPI00385D7B99